MPADSMTNKEIYFLEHSNLIYVINYSISECGWGSITQRVNTMHDIQHGNLPPTGQMNNNKYYQCLSSNELYKKGYIQSLLRNILPTQSCIMG
jgi:hypothetical protein